MSVAIRFDIDIFAAFAARSGRPVCMAHDAVLGATGNRMDAELLDAVVRLIEASQSREVLACLMQGLISAIHCRLLKSDAGDALRVLCSLHVPISQIRSIIGWTKENTVHLSRSWIFRRSSRSRPDHPQTFQGGHVAYPIQYQKMLRLSEARRMLERNMSVSEAAETLGYESPMQFCMADRKMHGIAPRESRKQPS